MIIDKKQVYVITILRDCESEVLYAANATNSLASPSFVRWDQDDIYSYRICKFKNKNDAIKWWQEAIKDPIFLKKTNMYDSAVIKIQKRIEMIKLEEVDSLNF